MKADVAPALYCGRSPASRLYRCSTQTSFPQIDIRLRPEAAAVLGLTRGECGALTETLITGSKVGEIYEEQKVLDVVVRVSPAVGPTSTRSATLIDTPGGGDVRLRDVTDVDIAPWPNEVKRESGIAADRCDLNLPGRTLWMPRA